MNKIIDLDKFNHYKTVKTIDEQYICVNPYDIYIGNNLIKNGIWEMHINNLLKAICKENMTVIDIGANIGTHTILMSKLVGEKGNVYAFEPS
jgi:protein-L-isoaspartate O-methyltransferase